MGQVLKDPHKKFLSGLAALNKLQTCVKNVGYH